MAWFIIQCERKTWTKYLVEAENKETALEANDDLQYVGYVDGEDTESAVIGGPFDGNAEALADVSSHVEG
jgi:hypothetical protein